MSGPRHGVVEHVSSLAFGPTLQRLKDKIACGAASIDRRAAARVAIEQDQRRRHAHADLARPRRVIDAGEHRHTGGCPALDLPLRVLVREDTDGRTVVSFRPVAQMLREAGVPDPLASRIEPAQQILVDAIATA